MFHITYHSIIYVLYPMIYVCKVGVVRSSDDKEPNTQNFY